MGNLTGEQIAKSFGGGWLAQVAAAIHDGTEAVKKATGHVGDGHFGWRTGPAGHDEHGYPTGDTIVYCGCGAVIVPAADRSDDPATG